MRVLMTADTVGGVWTYAHELTAGLLARGHWVTLVTLGRSLSDHQRRQADELACLGQTRFRCVETEYKLEWMRECEQDLPASQRMLERLVEREEPDVLHLNQFFYGALRTSAPKIVVAHSDVLSWWRAVNNEEAPENDWLKRYRGWVTQGAQGADAIIFPTAWMRTEFESIYGNFRNAQVIWNGVSAGAGAPVRKRLRAFAAGRIWDEAKNLAMLEDVDSPIPICIAGECNAPGSEPGAAATQEASRKRANYLGPLPPHEVKNWMRTSAVFIAPSRYEPFGLAALEAATCGCALLLSDLPSHREVWQSAAAYFDPREPASLAGLLQRLSRDPEELARLSADAHSRAAECFSFDGMTDHYCNLYASLASQRAAA